MYHLNKLHLLSTHSTGGRAGKVIMLTVGFHGLFQQKPSSFEVKSHGHPSVFYKKIFWCIFFFSIVHEECLILFLLSATVLPEISDLGRET